MRTEEISKWRQNVFDSTSALRSILSPFPASTALPAVSSFPRRVATLSSGFPVGAGDINNRMWAAVNKSHDMSSAARPRGYSDAESSNLSAVPAALAPAAGAGHTILQRPVSIDIDAAVKNNLLNALNNSGDLSAAGLQSADMRAQNAATTHQQAVSERDEEGDLQDMDILEPAQDLPSNQPVHDFHSMANSRSRMVL